MKKFYLFLLFLIINFGGLALASWFMGDAVSGDWYDSLNKAPWTPPGWVFGAAWTLIMVCFSIYLSYLFTIWNSKVVIGTYSVAVLLNVLWNYLFFNQQLTTLALVNIIILTIIIIYFFISFGDDNLSRLKYLLVPYIIWLCIATSLNAYVVLYN
ncbi:TspO/MBR related protein [Winogradskyella epiphytica]|uniref:TspO/MBR related protein n=1 Tax=Winogradskyella epiphytica TaxID=262005 RepID=A0A2V4XD04_9FLAO|nr:TspO/MBR family protein [Winogradskyella epiphytica]PYE80239.1 TspO/MBR related protein [Winogradskyella epiphytica]GGW69972.1 sensory protein TspO [Winogradskyella epiphytica]